MPNCLGNEVESGCVEYTGPDIDVLGIKTGDNLDSVLTKVAAAVSTIAPDTGSSVITSDDIVSKSLRRSNGSVCAAKIIKRDFGYTLEAVTTGIRFAWNILPVATALPSKYEVATTRVRISGKPVGGMAIINDGQSLASSLILPINRYPIVVEITVRITAPCGNIDMTALLEFTNPAVTGSFTTTLDVSDLNPVSGEINLTDQLNVIEDRVNTISMKIDGVPAVATELEKQKGDISSLKDSVNVADNIVVSYTKDGGTRESDLPSLVNDLFAEIKVLKEQDVQRQSELVTIKAQLNSTL